MMTTLTARPEAITFDPQQSALIVVDMQNAYATPGGYLDLAGFDVSTTRPVIANIQTAVTAARILLERLYIERSLSVNTAAAGGNASLMTIG